MKRLPPETWTRGVNRPVRAFEKDIFGCGLAEFFAFAPVREALDDTPAIRAAMTPAMTLAETPLALEARFELPGVEVEDVSLRIEGDRLILSGEKRRDDPPDAADWHVIEPTFGGFYRALTLPFAPAAEAVAARLDKGVLRVTIGKAGQRTGAVGGPHVAIAVLAPGRC